MAHLDEQGKSADVTSRDRSFFVLNELIRSSLAKNQLIEPLTEFVGSMNQAFTFVGSFAVLLALLAATGILNSRKGEGI